MASFSYHPTRSISLPSRPHPNSIKIERTVKKLKSWDLSSSSASISGSLGAQTIHLGLFGLVELYSNVQDLINSPSSQQALLRHDNGRLIEDAIDGSLRLLDACSNARDLILRLKEQVWDLQSALRRKGCSCIKNELSFYMAFRKKMTKDVTKCLRGLKLVEGKNQLADPLLELSPHLATVVRVLREAYVSTVDVFRFLFFFLTMPAKASGWSRISRLVNKRSGVRPIRREEVFNEVVEVDLALDDLDDTKVDVQLIGDKLQSLDASIPVLEGELEGLFRCLLENRVSLLNILAH